jgi:hypothetical protein
MLSVGDERALARSQRTAIFDAVLQPTVSPAARHRDFCSSRWRFFFSRLVSIFQQW